MPQQLEQIQLAQAEGAAPEHGAPAGEATHAAVGHEGGHHEYKLGDIPDPWLLFSNGLIVIAILVAFGWSATRKMTAIPRRWQQNMGEWIVEIFVNFTRGVIGPGGEKYAPFIGTLFFFIYVSNVWGLIPGFHAPSANLSTNLALGLIVFFYVQFLGIKNNGLFGYLGHFAGPMKAVAPLLFVIEVISELVKPLTLAMRLFGNIFGEDTVIIAFAALGVAVLPAFPIIPLQFPILLLAMMTTFVQALVFSLLATIYISLMSHHVEAHSEHEAAAAH